MARRLLGKILREEIAMRKVTLLSALLPLILIVACSDDNSTVAPGPAPLTPDQQTIANCRALQDALETYAAAHNGSYGEYYTPSFHDLGLEQMTNAYTGEYEPSAIRASAPGQIGLEDYTCGENVLGYRITGYGKDNMLITLEALANVPADLLYAHDVTVANALLVLDAAKRYAADNDGEFATDVAGDTDKNGNTLQDHLPNGRLLINPYMSVQVEPQDGLGLAVPGAIGYNGADSGTGIIDVFAMEAYDCNGGIMLTMLPYETQYGEIIWSGSYQLRFAIETFASASGHYPHDLDLETTPGGKTVLDLLSEVSWEHTPYFVNYYNQEHYVPVLGIATGNFSVGYQPIETAGVVTDYVITGRTMFREIIRLGPRPLP